MPELGGWATETMNTIVKLPVPEQLVELERVLSSVPFAERKALYDNVERRAHTIQIKAVELKRMTRFNNIAPEEIREQEQKAEHWAAMLRVATRFV